MRIRIGLVKGPTVAPVWGRFVLATRDSIPALWSFQQVAGSLAGLGDVHTYDLSRGSDVMVLGSALWGNTIPLEIRAYGTSWETLDPSRHDIWGVTCNYTQERPAALMVIRWLARFGAKVIVGGSDAFYCPQPFLEAGASIVLHDKSGASNEWAVRTILGEAGGSLPHDVFILDGDKVRRVAEGKPRLHPEAWPLPPLQVVRDSLSYTRDSSRATLADDLFSRFGPSGSVMLDQGCDRSCNFCGTPGYHLGYQAMSPERTHDWLVLQRDAGARSVLVVSDQFLGRVLWKGDAAKRKRSGREEVLEIMGSVKRLGLKVLWYNGIELSKLTHGRGIDVADIRPDEELIGAMFGSECIHAYVPGERPLRGADAYRKLLHWEAHVEVVKAIARAGVPLIRYGIIIGFLDDTHEELQELFEALLGLREELLNINPRLRFSVTPSAITAFPGTTFWKQLVDGGNLDQNLNPALTGKWTPSITGGKLAWWEVALWQMKFQETFTSGSDMGATLPTPEEFLKHLRVA